MQNKYMYINNNFQHAKKASQIRMYRCSKWNCFKSIIKHWWKSWNSAGTQMSRRLPGHNGHCNVKLYVPLEHADTSVKKCFNQMSGERQMVASFWLPPNPQKRTVLQSAHIFPAKKDSWLHGPLCFLPWYLGSGMMIFCPEMDKKILATCRQNS